ncbi:MAG: hypothetical protein QXL51_00280 [Candidatus Aenigmatarchaeota archaeon]
MFYDDLKQILEKSLFREIQARERENIELNRKVYEILLPVFPSFKLVKLEKVNNEKVNCLGYFENRDGKHLMKFSGLIRENKVEIDINSLQKALDDSSSSEKTRDIIIPQVSEFLEQNKNKISEVVSLINFLLDQKKLSKVIDEVLGGYDLESIYLKNILSISGVKVSFSEMTRLVRDTYLNFDYLLDLDRMIELLKSLKEKILSFKKENDYFFKRELPYSLETYSGEIKQVKACVYYTNLNDPDSIDVYFTDTVGNPIPDGEDYSANKVIKADIFEKIKKEAESGISVPFGYQTSTIRINKAFLPDNLEVGDVIVLDGITYKLVSKDENKLSTIGEGSYYVFTPVIEVGGIDDDK